MNWKIYYSGAIWLLVLVVLLGSCGAYHDFQTEQGVRVDCGEYTNTILCDKRQFRIATSTTREVLQRDRLYGAEKEDGAYIRYIRLVRVTFREYPFTHTDAINGTRQVAGLQKGNWLIIGVSEEMHTITQTAYQHELLHYLQGSIKGVHDYEHTSKEFTEYLPEIKRLTDIALEEE